MAGHEDLIDFPCSDTFRGYFYERGLTPHPASDQSHNATNALRREMRDYHSELVELFTELLETALQGSQQRSRYVQAPTRPRPDFNPTPPSNPTPPTSSTRRAINP